VHWALFLHFLISFLFAHATLITALVGVAVLLDYGNVSAALHFLLMTIPCGCMIAIRWWRTRKHEITLTQKAAVGYFSLIFLLIPLAYGGTGIIYHSLSGSGAIFVLSILLCGVAVMLYHLFLLLDFPGLPKREKILRIGTWGLYNPRLKSRRRNRSRGSRRWVLERRS